LPPEHPFSFSLNSSADDGREAITLIEAAPGQWAGTVVKIGLALRAVQQILKLIEFDRIAH
jgi:hypothetical protein